MCHVGYLVRNGGPEAMTTGSLQGKGPLQDLEGLGPWRQRLLPDSRLLPSWEPEPQPAPEPVRVFSSLHRQEDTQRAPVCLGSSLTLTDNC